MLEMPEAPTVDEARVVRDAAKEALAKLERERADLPAQHRAAVERGSFEDARRIKDQIALLEDRVTFSALQLARSEVVVLGAELTQARTAQQKAASALNAAFDAEAEVQQELQQATARRLAAQADVGTCTAHLEDLQQQLSAAQRRLQQEG